MTTTSPTSPSPSWEDGLQLSVDELRARQLARLQDSVRRAWEHVPHYRRVLDAAGVHPDEIRDLADLAGRAQPTDSDLSEALFFRTGQAQL